jgi:NAD(P)-dependent dehydrogenase (short-subunit alcohol dehydrogenase family)
MPPTQTLLITGTTAGLGLETTRLLARQHPEWHLVAANRDPGRAQAALDMIRAEAPGASIESQALDLASLASVRAFAERARAATWPPIRAVVCNAGLQFVTEQPLTVDGFEPTFQINHLGHFLLVQLLLPLLREPAQILFLGSGTHNPEEKSGLPDPRFVNAEWIARPALDPHPPADNVRDRGRRAYATSKLCNVMTALELDPRLQAEGRGGIRVNVYDPGLMTGSGLARTYTPIEQWVWRNVYPLMQLWDKRATTPHASARQLTRLITDPTLADKRGLNFTHRDLAVRPVSREALDADKRRDLWETSQRLAGLVQPEGI